MFFLIFRHKINLIASGGSYGTTILLPCRPAAVGTRIFKLGIQSRVYTYFQLLSITDFTRRVNICCFSVPSHCKFGGKFCGTWWSLLRQQLPGYKRKGFDTLFALITWHLWKERNARVFRSAAASVNLVIHMIRQEGLY